MTPTPPSTKKSQAKPYCFVSYSSREPHIQILVPCLWIALSPHFELKLTPSALQSGASQHGQIEELIQGCDFAVVSLDGLRPNVTYEYGILQGCGKPVILLREKDARVDVTSLIGNAPAQNVIDPPLNIDQHFSNVKDMAYVLWDRQKPDEAVKIILAEYEKKKSRIKNSVAIKAPKLWSI